MQLLPLLENPEWNGLRLEVRWYSLAALMLCALNLDINTTTSASCALKCHCMSICSE